MERKNNMASEGYLLQSRILSSKDIDKEGWTLLHTNDVHSSRGGGKMMVYYLMKPSSKKYRRKFSLEYIPSGGKSDEPEWTKIISDHDDVQKMLRHWSSPKKSK